MSHKIKHAIDSTDNHDVSNLVDGQVIQRSGTAITSAGITPSEIALLDAFGKLFVSQLPASVMTYEGQWNAATNTPALSNATGTAGSVYLVSTAGTTDFGVGPIEFAAGDWVIHNGTIWEKSVNTNLIQSVNNQVGVVQLNAEHIPYDDTVNSLGTHLQTALTAFYAEKASADGLATLGANSKLADNQVPTTVKSDTYTADHTLVLANGGKVVEMNVSAANVVTVPADATINFPLNTLIEVFQLGTGKTSIVADTGVNIRTPTTLIMMGQNSSVTLRKRAADDWVIAGDLESV